MPSEKDGPEYALRPALQLFATEMEQKLLANDHKGHWRGCDFDYLETRLRGELAELATVLMQFQIASLSPAEVTRTRHLAEKVIREAADVANFAMMIADNAREFLQPPPSGGK